MNNSKQHSRVANDDIRGGMYLTAVSNHSTDIAARDRMNFVSDIIVMKKRSGFC